MRRLSFGRRQFLRRALTLPFVTLLAGTPRIGQTEPAALLRRLRFNPVFRNPRAYTLPAQRFWCYLPFGQTATQRLVSTRVSADHRLLHDRLGHNILELDFGSVPAYAHKQVNITCEVELRETLEANPEDGAQWLRPERYVESDDPSIRGQAEILRRETPAASARAIYDWVRSNLAYAGFIAPDLGARHALLSRRGDCTEFAGLTVALARALGIPARVIGGYVSAQDFVLCATDYHNWAELLFDGAWRIIDAQKEHWLASPLTYIGFRIHSPDPVNVLGMAHRYRVEGEIQVKL